MSQYFTILQKCITKDEGFFVSQLSYNVQLEQMSPYRFENLENFLY